MATQSTPIVSCLSAMKATFSFVPTPSVPETRTGSLRSEEHTSELQSRPHLVCRLLLEKKKQKTHHTILPRASIHFFFFYGHVGHRDLHSFPTRRSSDLEIKRLRALRDNIVHAHGDAVDADRVVLVRHEGDFQLRADSVRP